MSVGTADHEREIIRMATLKDDRSIARIDSFMTNEKWSGIVDIQQGPDGSFYVAEYGHGYYTPNPTAKISRIDYVGKPCGAVPVARPAEAPKGPAPRLAYADPARGLALAWPSGATRAEAIGLDGKVLWSGAAPMDRIPASSIGSRGLVWLRYR